MTAQGTLTIDGSRGEGGGQIVRSSLSLSLVTGRRVIIEKIRAGRKKPGLLRQHLTAVQAATQISAANVSGDQLNSSRLDFEPGAINSRSYSFRVGTAGSTTLVFQTILPALMIAEAQSEVLLEGGTHNPFAPPFDFLKKTFLPLLGRMGPSVSLELQRYGFFPAGGGRIRAVISPSPNIGPLRLVNGGDVSKCRMRALVAQLPEHIGRRECRTIARKLHWKDKWCSVESIRDSNGPGNVVLAEVRRAGFDEVFTGFGRRGVPAEKVANDVVRQIRRFVNADAPVDEFLADQLLLPLAIGAHFGGGGGEFRTLDLSQHAQTHIDLLRMFLDVQIEVDIHGTDNVTIRVLPH